MKSLACRRLLHVSFSFLVVCSLLLNQIIQIVPLFPAPLAQAGIQRIPVSYKGPQPGSNVIGSSSDTVSAQPSFLNSSRGMSTDATGASLNSKMDGSSDASGTSQIITPTRTATPLPTKVQPTVRAQATKTPTPRQPSTSSGLTYPIEPIAGAIVSVGKDRVQLTVPGQVIDILIDAQTVIFLI